MDPNPNVGDRLAWERCVRASFNHYYRCAAVSQVAIGGRGIRFYEWLVTLAPTNDPRFLEPHLVSFLSWVRSKRQGGGFEGPDALIVAGTDASGGTWSTQVTAGERVASHPR
jgi:hypothetical protein